MSLRVMAVAAVLASCQGEPVVEGTVDGGSNTGDAPAAGCASERGPKMVRVGSFCIDSTEVTRRQFLDFMKVPRDARKAPAYCAWNTTDPEEISALPAGLDFPVGFVNFCDAATYCAWAGKRLCGRIGGGELTPAEANEAGKSEWMQVCSVGGAQVYPYPGEYQSSKCFTESVTTDVAGARTSCAGASPPHSQVYDLVGNAVEWEHACDAAPSAAMSTHCRTRGGGYDGNRAAKCALEAQTRVDTRAPGIGFRCCAAAT